MYILTDGVRRLCFRLPPDAAAYVVSRYTSDPRNSVSDERDERDCEIPDSALCATWQVHSSSIPVCAGPVLYTDVKMQTKVHVSCDLCAEDCPDQARRVQ